jgi:hypothetical protein
MPHARVVVGSVAKPLHDIRPGAGDELGVLRRQIRLGQGQIHQRLVDGLVSGQDKFPGFGLAAGVQTLLLAGGSVFTVENGSAPEQCETVLHSCLS